MQIGNNSTGAPQPRDPLQTPLEPDLTKANREGIKSTSRIQAEKTKEAHRAAENRARDSFEPSRPQKDVGMDVGERIKNARAQAARAQANRVENARAGSVGARSETTPRADAQRISNARGGEAARIENARSDAQRISSARSEDSRVDGTQRIEAARGQERVENARGQERVENARSGSLSRESVELSSRSRRLASGELPGTGGRRESLAERADRLEALRIANARGELNTPERARRAAGRLLGGE